MFKISKGSAFLAASAAVLGLSVGMTAQSGLAASDHSPSNGPIYLDQGDTWTMEKRLGFYSQDQGSQLIPLAWLNALKTADGQPFMYDQLARYGYLPNPDSPNDLPVGFTISDWGDVTQAGMSCAACHTREISVDGQDYRVDGGPAIVDFQLFLTDLVDAVGRVNSDDAAFASFAEQVLAGDDNGEQNAASLKVQVNIWYVRENTLRRLAYGTPDMWGLGRLDAVSMIFNRLVGLDIGDPPDYIIPENIKPADAPVRYPFLWNASIQDKTQWPGFADNGSDTLALARNAGEVVGVFGTFHPRKHSWRLTGMTFKDSSLNWDGLRTLEDYIKEIGPPRYQWQVREDLVPRGQELYERDCSSCHGIAKGKTRFPFVQTWSTPIIDVGTDRREHMVLERKVADSGQLTGVRGILNLKDPIPASGAKAFDLLGLTVGGVLIQGGLFSRSQIKDQSVAAQPAPDAEDSSTINHYYQELKGAFPKEDERSDGSLCDPAPTNPANIFCYESRVMQGIWAAGPYLHNGSVPTLADLLEPSSKRPARFAMGNAYDVERLGIAKEQPGSSYYIETTDCSDLNSGNSRCGHEGPGFGTDLSEEDKVALLEYLKTL